MDSESGVILAKAQRRLEKKPADPIVPPAIGAYFAVDQAVVDALPDSAQENTRAFQYCETVDATLAKVVVELPRGPTTSYFLKTMRGETSANKCEGEFESLKALHAVSPAFVPKPYAWGQCKGDDQASFLLEEFRELGQHPADPEKLATGLANLHLKSRSPTGKFGFHVRTWQGRIDQAVDQWDDYWASLFGRHLEHILSFTKPIVNSREFDTICRLTVDQVVPRLLLPLQEHGRNLKPSLIHGDCHDGNTALDAASGEALVYDSCSFYGHNEYDTGNWRTPRHRISDKAYVLAYKNRIPPSEPVEDWGARNMLYSLCFNAGNLFSIPGSVQRDIIIEDMTTLCRMLCPEELDNGMMTIQRDEQAAEPSVSG